ncbi:MAG: glycosyltransferase [Thermoanaerobaculia bacterium]
MNPAAGALRGFLDSPQSGSTLAPGLFQVLGWAFDDRGSVAVDVEVDGELVDRARLGLPRPDVAGALGDPNALFAGWECVLDLDALAAGRRSLRLEALAHARAGGRVSLGTASLHVGDAGPAPRNAAEDHRRDELRRRLDLLLDRQPAPPRRPDGRLRILAVLHNLDLGGSQLILLERLRELIAEGAAEAVVVSPGDGALREELESLGVPCHVTGPLILPDPILYEGKIAELAMWCRPQGFDVVLASTISSSPAIDLAQRLGLPSLWLIYERLVSARHLLPGIARTWPAYALEQANEALRRCPLLVFDSDACRRDYLEKAPPERLLTIPGAIDVAGIDRFRAAFDRVSARRACGLPEGATLVLGLGSILSNKGTPQLVQAFAALAAEQPDLRLALVGSRHDLLAELIGQFVAARGLQDRVFLEPMGTEAYRWLGMADLLVCPSQRESMPRIVLEAMAFEVPVLATTVGDVPGVIADGASGWLIPPSDPVALESALRRALAASSEERSAMVGAAARFVREHRDARLAAARFAAALRRVMAA